MSRLGKFLDTQGNFILENNGYAWLYIAILVLLPFANWLAVAIVALITLRKGWKEGLLAMIVGIASLQFFSLITSASFSLIAALIVFLPCYLTAFVLRLTADWQLAMFFLVLQILVGIAGVHYFVPEFISQHYQFIQTLLKELDKDGTLLKLSEKSSLNPVVIANYIVGVQALSIALAALASLMLARSIQSRLFYLGGYKKEILAFQAKSIGLILLALVILGVYQELPLALSCLPILVIYYVSAGLSLAINVLAKDYKLGVILLLLLSLVLVPFGILPIYFIVGALDSLFNFRSYLLSKVDRKQNKR